MRKIELLLPAGDIDSLRAAVNNGADAVYFGLRRFNARGSAANFSEEALSSVIRYCHDRNVKAYVALNILIKNSEVMDFLHSVNIAESAGADAIIIQDPCMIEVIRKNFPAISIHLSTQASVVNSYSIPEMVDRVILSRELSLDEIRQISKKHETEIFIHGALCFSYSGQCLFSSMIGGRSANRGMCRQPCRKRYNNRYLLSTMDLCALERLPDIIGSGVKSLKVEGRMRSSYYVSTVAKIYRKYIDQFYGGDFKVEERDITELKLAFNRGFTQGWAFADSVVDSRMGKNRGLFIGKVSDDIIILKENLEHGDGIRIIRREEETGGRIDKIYVQGKTVKAAKKGIHVSIPGTIDGDYVYKTSNKDTQINLGDGIILKNKPILKKKYEVHLIHKTSSLKGPRIFARAYNKKDALDAKDADVIYYDALDDEIFNMESIRHKLYLKTPRIVSDIEIDKICRRIREFRPGGVLVSNRGFFKRLRGFEMHIDYCLNAFNDIDVQSMPGVPIISPELSLEDLRLFRSRDFIVFAHGDIVLMASKEKITKGSISDDEGRTFRVRVINGTTEILNSRRIGLFSLVNRYIDVGIVNLYIDLDENLGKYVSIYRKIISQDTFDDRKLKKGFTTGHFRKSVL